MRHPPQSANYGYDEFNRLASRTITSGTVQNFAWEYDRWGNRTRQTVTAGLNGPQPQFTMNTSNNQISGFTYDAAGNMTNDGTNSYTYDPEGNIISVVTPSQTATYLYNALNQRVRTIANGVSTEYLYNANGQRVSEWNPSTQAQLKGHYYWGGNPVAYYTTASGGGAALHFEHQDWLGTERMRTGYNGGVEGTYQSLPWGDGQSTSGTDTDAAHYAALDYDSETNTDHAQFRQHNLTQGRFMSPDPYDGSYDFTNPQSLNRYTYALDSPLSAIDPTGLMMCQNINCGGGDGSGGHANLPNDSGMGGFGSGWVWETEWMLVYLPRTFPDGRGGSSVDGHYWALVPSGGHWVAGIGTQVWSSGSGKAKAPNKGTPKSAQRQQCEQVATARYQGAVGNPQHQFNVGLLIGGLGGGVTGAVRGATTGCLITAEVGCWEGALAGGLGGFAVGAAFAIVPTAAAIGVNIWEAKQQYNQDMQGCSQQ